MSIGPTSAKAAPYSSGAWFTHAPTSSPALLDPTIATFEGAVYLFWMRYFVAHWKSSKTFCLCSSLLKCVHKCIRHQYIRHKTIDDSPKGRILHGEYIAHTYIPDMCHPSPYSPPPLRLGTAKIPP